ncbi:MAG: hypothetical protein Kow0047_03670 [Anaerolineae bacterium]
MRRRKRVVRNPRPEIIKAAQQVCWRAMAEYEKGRFAEALDLFRKADRDCPGLRDVHAMQGWCLYYLGDLLGAAEQAVIEVKAHPDHYGALHLLGKVRLDQGRVEEALIVLQKAHELKPQDKEIAKSLHLAEIQLTEQRRSQAEIPPDPPDEWPTISVCMIVRNEEANLPRCLRSLQDLATQLVIVDTGSTDRTIEIAREAGAEVHHFEWCDDFAAARNESLRHARGEWILWMDADDELPPRSVAQIKRAVVSGLGDAYNFQVASPLPDGNEDVVAHIRLFKNGLGIRFHGRIHEMVYPSIVSLQARLVDTDIQVIHHGYERDAELLRSKHRRNLAYLERELERQPDRVDLLSYLGISRNAVGDLDGAEEALIKALSAPYRPGRFNELRFWAWASLLGIYERRKDLVRLADAAERALAEFPDHPFLLAARGALHVKQGDAEGAIPWLEAALAQDYTRFLGVRPRRAAIALNLAACYAVLGDHAHEERWLQEAGYPAHEGVKLYLLWAEDQRKKGHWDVAARVAHRVVTHWPEDPAGWRALALISEHQGRLLEAYAAWALAAEHGQQEPEVGHRMVALAERIDGVPGPGDPVLAWTGAGLISMKRGQFSEAATYFGEAIQRRPEDPAPYRYLAVALQKLGQQREAQEVWQIAQALQRSGRTGGVTHAVA